MKTIIWILSIGMALMTGGMIYAFVMLDKEKKKNMPKKINTGAANSEDNYTEVTADQASRMRIVGDITNMPKKCPAGSSQVKLSDGSYACVANMA